MTKTEKTDSRFQPPKNVSENDLPNILYAKGDKFSIDVTEVKESFTWFINMADFLKATELRCRDCALYPDCGRYPKSDQKIGFCYEEKTEK